MELREQYARLICQSRGAVPDLPITIHRPQEDGSIMEDYQPIAWVGYTDLADELLALHEAVA